MAEKTRHGYILPCPLEMFDREDGYVVIYDGQKRPPNDGSKQFTSAPEEIRYFTRVLRKMENGEFVDKWKKYVYDLRNGYLVDIKATRYPPNSGMKKAQGGQVFTHRERGIEAGT
jgi:hypothetical protein